MFCYGIKSAYNGDFFMLCVACRYDYFIGIKGSQKSLNKNDEIALIRRI